MKIGLIFISIFVVLGCTKDLNESMIITPDSPSENSFTYLALGDSYTIGESLPINESFPYQYVSRLKMEGLNISNPKIIAKTGWTTDELQAAIRAENIKNTYDFVTLLIGVNNQYRGYSKDKYRKEFKELLQTAIDFAKGDKNRVFVLSIPDWGATPFGSSSGRSIKSISDDIDAFNQINKEETIVRGVSYTDITSGTRVAPQDPSLVAKDRLHYSVKMHSQWAKSLPVPKL
ncbi:MAG: SGNH/GDSL hydrolase family protein [Pedobacter sp.]|nr:MAG: SGNH/GDSL hydrolase family protein [Pedobacter sp.]